MTDTPGRRLVAIYRSARVAEMYLYVDRSDGLTTVPSPLLERFGNAALVTVLALDATRRLARTSAADVLADIDRQGYHLQLPPPPVARDEHGVRADHSPLVASSRRVRGREDD